MTGAAGGPITGAAVVPCHWRRSAQSGPITLAGDRRSRIRSRHPPAPVALRLCSSIKGGLPSAGERCRLLLPTGRHNSPAPRCSVATETTRCCWDSRTAWPLLVNSSQTFTRPLVRITSSLNNRTTRPGAAAVVAVMLTV